MKAQITLKDLYRFPGFRPLAKLVKHPYDPRGHVLTLKRRQKKLCALVAEKRFADSGVAGYTEYVTWMPVTPISIWTLNTGGLRARTVAR
jgi:hypothetical protein